MLDINRVWKYATVGLSAEITAVEYMLWIENLKPICVKDGALIVLAPSLHAKQTIIRSYKNGLDRSLKANQKGTELTEVIIIDDDEKDFYLEYAETEASEGESVETASNNSADSASFESSGSANNSGTNGKNGANGNSSNSTGENGKNPNERSKNKFISRYTFDNFVVGESNKFAFHAAQSVANNPGSAEGYLSFNPLFIYGGVGLGKTHLLHAIGNSISMNIPDYKILYVPTENLTNDYVEAISNNSSNDKSAFNFKSFREKYRSVDVLMLDDVQFLQKRTGLQEMVFHIFNDLYQHGKQIILTSDRPPISIPTLEDRLRSRFEGGLLVDIGTPNLDMRIAIIKKKMMLEKIAIHDDVVEFLAEQFDSNIRELEGALSKVILYSSLIGMPYPDIKTAKAALRIDETKKTGIDSNDVINACCTYYHINRTDIVGKKKTKEIAEARMIAIYLIRNMLSLPLVTIGQMFGGRDHTTILYSADKIAADVKEKKDIAMKVKDIKDLLKT